MRCPTLRELPPPPPGRHGWPWTEETPPLPELTPDGAAATMLPGRRWPSVSIVTPSLNQGAYIEETIRSVLLQGYPNLEYIIIDGVSSDQSVEVIRKYEPWLARWVSEPDRGTSDAMTKGFATATGEVFGFMCADDIYARGGVRTLMERRDTHRDAVAWVGACPYVDSKGTEVFFRQPVGGDASSLGDWWHQGWFFSVACLFDAEVFRRARGFDERFKIVNDVDLWCRMATFGSFSIISDQVATARVSANSLSRLDPPGQISELIASNIINGHRDVARRILVRYGEAQAQRAPGLVIASVGRWAVAQALGRSVAAALVRRARRVLGGRSGGG